MGRRSFPSSQPVYKLPCINFSCPDRFSTGPEDKDRNKKFREKLRRHSLLAVFLSGFIYRIRYRKNDPCILSEERNERMFVSAPDTGPQINNAIKKPRTRSACRGSRMVRATGVEPAASWTPFKRATKLRYARIPSYYSTNHGFLQYGNCEIKSTNYVIAIALRRARE